MTALKGIVFIMTLAIAVLMTLIAYGLYQKSQDPDFKFIDLSGDEQATSTNADAPAASTPPPAPAQDTRLQTFGDITVDIPSGATVRSASISADRLILVLDAPEGTQIWVVDPASGKLLGRVLTQPKDGT